jgi:ATP-dependent Clp protease ATP-binding subunit ClpC
MQSKVLNKFTTHLKKTLSDASALAATLSAKTIDVEHVLYSLLQQKGSIGAEILMKAGLKTEDLQGFLQPPAKPIQHLPKLSGILRESLEKAAVLAKKNHHQYIGTEHLLLGLLELNSPLLLRMLNQHRISVRTIEQHLRIVLRSTSKFPDLTRVFEHADHAGTDEMDNNGEESRTPALDFFATDLTDREQQSSIDPVIGRDQEIERLIHILSRRTKNNPVLIGEPGVGKTAIVEGLAKKILEGDVPEALVDKRIMSLDLSLLVAGTIYRGEFEGRIKQVIDEIKSDPNIILFIDEIHTIVGTGSTSGSMDAANILKPALAKGQIRCIGATTLDEYRKHIESDAALERRFQPIIVEEPSMTEAIDVLRGIKDNYENYHLVQITDEAIESAVRLSDRYIQEKQLPDKAIDLIDEAASKIKVTKQSNLGLKQIREIEKQINEMHRRKLRAVNQENFAQALDLKTREKALRERLAQLRQQVTKGRKQFLGKVTSQDIADIVGRMTKIPVQDLVLSEKERLLKLEELLNESLIGQEEAVKTVAEYIRRSRAGLASPDRPIASFIFLGPSGVGKTLLAKHLARIVFESEKSLVRIDMSEFSEGFQASKLIGAPAGYVGYKEGTKLTDVVRRQPYSVVLFDEIEKGHPDIFNLLLQILDEGHLTDASGKKVNFKNTIIIMTSNIGLEIINKETRLGFNTAETRNRDTEERFEEIKHDVRKKLEDRFRPEFLNRVDKIITFRPLKLKDVEKIVEIQMKEVEQHLEDKNIALEIKPSAIKWIAKKSFSPTEGARAVRRTIQEVVENPLSEGILSNTFEAGDVITITTKNNKVVLEK